MQLLLCWTSEFPVSDNNAATVTRATEDNQGRVTETCDIVPMLGVNARAPVSPADGRGGFPKDDPGSREDGRRRAARETLLLHDVE